MPVSEKMLIFLCSGAAKAGNKKLSYRIATRLQALGVGDIGTIQDMSEQNATSAELRKKMVFINDCRSGCVNVFTHGFDKNNYIFFDVSPFLTTTEFDIDNYIHAEVFSKLNEKWSCSLSL
jgi:uncharacterized metal-binding protein